MEKKTPHCKLSVVKALIAQDKVSATSTAMAGAVALGCDYTDMLNIVNDLTMEDFHKSMTTHSDSTVWQDVYRPVTKFGGVYLKVTVIDDVLIVSFKEL